MCVDTYSNLLKLPDLCYLETSLLNVEYTIY